MPTNLPPECADLEQRYREASTPEQKIACLEDLLAAIPKHKGTDKLRANYRKRLSKLKDAASSQKAGVARQVSAYHIDREGAGQVVLFGPGNVGKSALVAALTNATPEVAAYPLATWSPTPGMMAVDNVQIQLIDTPSLNPDFVDPEQINLIRRADLLWLVIDLQAFPIEQLDQSLDFLAEYRIAPSRWKDRYADEQRLTFLPFLVLVNKVDDESLDQDFEVLVELLEEDWPLIPVSAETGRYLDRLKQATFDRLEIMRVYSKPPGKEPDLSAPFVLKRGSTVETFAGKVHRDFIAALKSARIWGHGVYDGQMVSRDHVLHDGDVVELRV